MLISCRYQDRKCSFGITGCSKLETLCIYKSRAGNQHISSLLQVYLQYTEIKYFVIRHTNTQKVQVGSGEHNMY